MKLRVRQKKQREENVIPLINVVFLMLIFFLIAGALRSFAVQDIELPNLAEAEQLSRKALHLHISKDGSVIYEGATIKLEDISNVLPTQKDITDQTKPLSVIADRELEASVLIEILEKLKALNIEKINIVAVRKEK